MPLTGLRADPGVDPHRAAVAIKVENAPSAWPLSGFEKADVVYEEVVEGGYTRFILLFQSHDADVVGSVRSVRPVDPDLLVQYGKPVVVASGGIETFKSAITSAGLVLVTEDDNESANGALYRRRDRSAPHNLFTNTNDIRSYVADAARGSVAAPPSDVFQFAPATTAATTTTSSSSSTTAASSTSTTAALPSSVLVDFPSQPMMWKYEVDRWYRYNAGGDVFLTEAGNYISTANVAIMSVNPIATGNVDASGSDVPSWSVVGSGALTLLTGDGRVVRGTWERPALGAHTTFLDATGARLTLTPGVTWMQLLPSDRSVRIS
jgi:hypothetical protein